MRSFFQAVKIFGVVDGCSVDDFKSAGKEFVLTNPLTAGNLTPYAGFIATAKQEHLETLKGCRSAGELAGIYEHLTLVSRRFSRISK